MNYMNGQAHLCEQHKEQPYVIGAVCPICVGIERQNLIAAYLGEEARIFELEDKLTKMQEQAFIAGWEWACSRCDSDSMEDGKDKYNTWMKSQEEQ